MAYKIKRQNFDLDVEIDLMDDTTVVVECKIKMTNEEYSNYLKFCANQKIGNTLEEQMEYLRQNPDEAIKKVIRTVDYLYKKGEDWWMKNVDPPVIMGVMERINQYHASLKREKK